MSPAEGSTASIAVDPDSTANQERHHWELPFLYSKKAESHLSRVPRKELDKRSPSGSRRRKGDR